MTPRAGETHRFVSAAAPERWHEVAGALAAAFQDDPVVSWLIPSAQRRPAALRRFVAIEARAIALPHGQSVAAGEQGAALVLPPGHWRAPFAVQARHGGAFTRAFGTRLPLAFAVLTALERRHARHAPGPHVYLPYIGVVPAASGQRCWPRCSSAAMTKACRPTSRRRAPAPLGCTPGSGSRPWRRSGRSGRRRSS
jgi:hypothetical protein